MPTPHAHSTNKLQSPQLMTDVNGGYQYGVFMTRAGKIIALRRHIFTNFTQTFDCGTISGNPLSSPSTGSYTDVDSNTVVIDTDERFSLACGIDSADVFHISGNDADRSSTQKYVVCSNVLDFTNPASWASGGSPFAARGSGGGAYTYNLFERLTDGTLLWFLSQAESVADARGTDWLAYKRVSGSWVAIVGTGEFASTTYDGLGGQTNGDGSANQVIVCGVYVQPRSGFTDRVHVSGLFRTGNKDPNTNVNPWYIYSDDLITWKQLGGATQTMPITWANMTGALISSATNPSPRYQTGITVDANGNPSMVFTSNTSISDPAVWVKLFANSGTWQTATLSGTQPTALHNFIGQQWYRTLTQIDKKVTLTGQTSGGVVLLGDVVQSCDPNPDPIRLRTAGVYSVCIGDGDTPKIWELGIDRRPLGLNISDPVAPVAPTNVVATPGDTSVLLNWTAPIDNGGSPIFKYIVTPYIGGVAQAQVAPLVVGTGAVVGGLTNNTAYSFTVIAVNNAGQSPESAHSAVVTPVAQVIGPGGSAPDAPTNVVAAPADTGAVLSWTAPNNNGAAITSFTVTPFIGFIAQPPQTPTFTLFGAVVGGLTNGIQYGFKVAATNSFGTGVQSTLSNKVTPTPASTNPLNGLDNTGTTDITTALQSIIDSAADGTTFTFPTGAQYRLDGTINVVGRTGLTFVGSNVTFTQTTPGTSTRAHFNVIDGATITFFGITLVGANPNAGTGAQAHNVSLDKQHGINAIGVNGLEINGVVIRGIYGDFVYLGHSFAANCNNVHIHNCTFDSNGRFGINLAGSTNVEVNSNTISNVALNVFDTEPTVSTASVTSINIHDNTFGPHSGFFYFCQGGFDIPINGITINNNTSTDQFSMVFTGTMAQPKDSLTITNNTSSVSGLGLFGSEIIVSFWDTVVITGNTQPLQSGVNLVSTRSCTAVTVSSNTFTGGALQRIDTPPATTIAAGASVTNLGLETLNPHAESPPYPINWNQVGQFVDLSFQIVTAASYNLVFRYAAADGIATRKTQLDGSTIVSELAFPATASWDTWSTVTLHNVSLSVGNHHLRLTFDGGSALFMNPDNLKIQAGTAITAPAAPTNVNVSVTSTTTATVSFTTPSDNGGSIITGYSTTATSSNGGTTVTVSGSSSPINLTGLTANRNYTATVTATNSVGSTTSAASAVFSTTITTGGRAAVLAALGAANGGGNDQPSYANSTHSHWAAANTSGALPGQAPPIIWCYLEADPQNTSLLDSVLTSGSNWITSSLATSGAVKPLVRLSCGDTGGNRLSNIAGGSLDSGWITTGQQLQRMYNASGIPPRVNLAWEWDGWWFAWAIGGIGGNAQVWNGSTNVNITNNITDFLNMWKRAVRLMKQQCPNALIYLNGGIGLGGGQGAIGQQPPSMTLWTNVVSSLQGTITGTGTGADGKKWIDGIGFDIYNDGWPFGDANSNLNYLNACLAAVKNFGVTWNLPIGIQELGIADPVHDTNIIPTSSYVTAMYNWFISLPTSGGGKLDHFLMFDVSPVDGNVGFRGWLNVITQGRIANQTFLNLVGY